MRREISYKIRLQRNLLVVVLALSIISNAMLSYVICTQNQKTIIIPSIAAEYEISDNYVSNNYLKNLTIEINNLLFSLNNENVDNISSSLLKLVAPEASEKFKGSLAILTEDIKRRNIRNYFTDIVNYKVDNNKLVVEVSGYLESFIEDQRISREYKSYRYFFQNKSGLVKLISFTEVKDADN